MLNRGGGRGVVMKLGVGMGCVNGGGFWEELMADRGGRICWLWGGGGS